MVTFKELALSNSALQRLENLRFTQPTPIQEEAIPTMLQGKNVVGQAQTGSGKTLAFALPTLQRLKADDRFPQALILAPTRELVLQICQVFSELRSHDQKKIQIIPIYGGASKHSQRISMRSGSQVIVATPGRLIDFLREKAINLSRIRTVVLDEVDRMLEMGFIDDVKFILGQLPKEIQMGLFSATISPAIHDIIRIYLTNPHYIRLETLAEDKPKIKQTCYGLEPQEKLDTLLRIIEEKQGSMLIFCRTRRGADRLTKKLSQSGHHVGTIHGGKSQNQREQALRGFRSGRPSLLVATDLASRGLDIQDVRQVVNFDIPEEPQDYLHRIGRTGRAGKEGTAVMFVTSLDSEKFYQLEKHLGESLRFAPEAPRPGRLHSFKEQSRHNSGGRRSFNTRDRKKITRN